MIMLEEFANNPIRLEKLKIHVYDERARIGAPQDTFEVMFNPSSYSLSYENIYQEYQGINTTGREAKYSLSQPEQLSLELILDKTVPEAHSLDLPDTKTISEQVKRFLELTSYMDGELHEPKFLKVTWGNLVFDCRLQSVEINYTLFKRDGTPLRANLNTVFIQDWTDSKRVKWANQQSADLTRVRSLQSSETLPMKAHEMYGDSTYYIQLAKVNKLNNFRKLKIGTVIHYPPMVQEK